MSRKTTRGRTAKPATKLGRKAVSFRSAHALSRLGLAELLGVSIHTIVSLESRSTYRPSELLYRRLEDVGVIPEGWRP